ncbi:MAG: extracellular solute-binding protein [Chloroflexota bacterium]
MMNSRMSRRSFLTSTAKVSALAAFGSVIAACAPAAPGAPADGGGDAAPSTEPIVLEFTQWGEGVVPGEQPPNYEPFLEENPHITIEHYSYPDYDQKLYLMLASGDMPDVFRTQDEPFLLNVKRGIYLNLESYLEIDAANFNQSEFYPGTWETFKYDTGSGVFGEGDQWAIPSTGGCILWIVNKDVFAAAGVDFPENNGWDWTTDDFIEIGQQIADVNEDGSINTAFFPWPGGVYNMPHVWTLDAEYFTPDKATCLLGEEQSIVAHQWLWDIIHTHRLTSVTGVELTGMSSSELLLSGKLAMQMNGPWGRRPFYDAGEDFAESWDFLHVPINPATGERGTRQTWDGTAISPQTEHADEAWEVVKFEASDWKLELTAKEGRHGSAKISIAEGPYFGANEESPQNEQVYNDALEYARLQPITEYWGQQWDIIGHYYDLMYNPEVAMSPEEACPAMGQDVQYLLDNGEIPPSYTL